MAIDDGKRFADQVAIVTGAASGIGLASAERLAREGAIVYLADRDGETVTQAAKSIRTGTAHTCVLDVTDRQACEQLAGDVSAAHGRIDILINSAGVTPRGLDQERGWEAIWDQVMAVNLKGSLLMSHAVTPAMKSQNRGAIVNLASIMSFVVYHNTLSLSDGFNPYPASKGGVVQMTRDMGVNLIPWGIRVNCVCPGFIRTNLTAGLREDAERLAKIESRHPIGRLGEPEEIASVICFLASRDASFVTAAAWPVDGGYTAS